MKNILWTTSNLIPSENKWNHILSIVQSSNASLTIMHVMADTTPLLYAVDGALERNHGIKFPKRKQEYHKQAERRLQDFIDKHKPKAYQSVKITGLVKVGNVIDAILSEEQTGKYDLLILGAPPTNSLIARIFGSVFMKVKNKSLTPVDISSTKSMNQIEIVN